MAENSKIEWCHHTFNPWVGCTKVSSACDHCYAEVWARRTGSGNLWQGERRRTGQSYWQQPLKWDKKAAAAGERHRVFCASLADVFDNQVPADWRRDLFALISKTPNLDWLLLTKRPQNIEKMLEAATDGVGGDWPWRNVWLGTSIENREELFRRADRLASVPAAVRFWSCEPLLEDLGDLLPWLAHRAADWVIVGGESGTGARPMHPDWARSIRDQCKAAGVPLLFKQWGNWLHMPERAHIKEAFREEWRRVESLVPGVRPNLMFNVGKKAAGRLLDGVTQDEYPEAAHG